MGGCCVCSDERGWDETLWCIVMDMDAMWPSIKVNGPPCLWSRSMFLGSTFIYNWFDCLSSLLRDRPSAQRALVLSKM